MVTRRSLACGYSLIVALGAAGGLLNVQWALTIAVVLASVFLATRAGVLRAPSDHLRGFMRTLVLAPASVGIGIVAAEHLSPRFLGLIVAGWSVFADVVARVWPDDDAPLKRARC